MAEQEGKARSLTVPRQNAAIMIIGDEILKGHTKDTNSYFLLQKLWALGVKAERVAVIPDEVDCIADEIRSFSESYSFVITTGGIGPTHDDVTLEGVAKAFGEKLVLNEELLAIISRAYKCKKDDMNAAQMKMAYLPASAQLIYGIDKVTRKKATFPVVLVHNVYIFPGIPQLLERDFNRIEHVFPSVERRFHLANIFLAGDESVFAAVLSEANEKFKETVHLGSYPDFFNEEFQVKLAVESDNPDKLKEAFLYLLKRLPKECVVRSEECVVKSEGTTTKSVEMNGTGDSDKFGTPSVSKIYSLLDPKDKSNLSACTKGAWAVIQETLRQYSLDELCISFNGGKDCTVLLHLLYAAVQRSCGNATKINAIYIQCESPFPQVEKFIERTTQIYGLNLIRRKGDIRKALEKLKATHPRMQGMFMGTRRHDPFSDKLRSFSPTDPGWPEFMRINPILDWHLSDVWSVLRECHIDYCSLYDEGYTSLGSSHNTKPNPALQLDGQEMQYKPAYMLEDESLERAGRK